MTTKELYNRISIGFCAGGQFEVTIEYRNKTYRCKSNNTLAHNCLWGSGGNLVYYSSEKQALKALWDECKQKNSL